MQSLLEQPQATPYGISVSLVDQNTFRSRCKLFVAVGKMLGLLQAVFCSAFKRAIEAPLYGVLLVAVDEDTGHPFRRFIAGNNVDSLQSLCLGRNNISSQSIHPTPCYDVRSLMVSPVSSASATAGLYQVDLDLTLQYQVLGGLDVIYEKKGGFAR